MGKQKGFTAVKVNNVLRDSDERSNGRHGVVQKVKEGSVTVKWNTGRSTTISQGLVHTDPTRKRGFLLVTEQPASTPAVTSAADPRAETGT